MLNDFLYQFNELIKDTFYVKIIELLIILYKKIITHFIKKLSKIIYLLHHIV